MITKFKSINNLAVFQDFEWDKSVIDEDGYVREFKPINILYGRNYSGKTTLSRTLRAMENGELSENYELPDFEISLKSGELITPHNLKDHSKTIRVFNEDFVREKLKFIVDPNESIESFAILGDNSAILEEIDLTEKDLGSSEEGKETGLYKELKEAEKDYSEKVSDHELEKNRLESQLKEKAINNPNGIKYHSEKFGDQNYNTAKLKKDITTVLKDDYQPISNEQKNEYEIFVQEKTLKSIPELPKIDLSFEDFAPKAEVLIQKDVMRSGKIQELVKDALLHQWVDRGRELHNGKHDNCAFCGNRIDEERWQKLEQHFDKESEQLKDDIQCLIDTIRDEKNKVEDAFQVDKDLFYSRFQEEIDNLKNSYTLISQKYLESLEALIEQLEQRKNDLFNSQNFTQPADYSDELLSHWNQYEQLRQKSNNLSNTLEKKQDQAKVELRLREVSDFIGIIKYSEKLADLDSLKDKVVASEAFKDELSVEIQSKEELLKTQKRELNDEEEGAKQVNKYLNNFFGHKFLSLRSIEDEEEKKIKFEVIREGKVAHHLSEGERNLITFCYFVAKLKDTETKGQNPIIWIDDPISSLDGNHIFFVFSLINAEIVTPEIFEQLFISTHNLDFLKYIKRLPGALKTKETTAKYRYLMVQRFGEYSAIQLMPNFLREYVTEFNFLFSQIYKCATLKKLDDSCHHLFYNFGNNARKFLEVFLFYKFPDNQSSDEKMKRFFGNSPIPRILIERISNEYSHLSGPLERGALPVEVPEMNSAAKLILDKIQELDPDQYEALLNSIGEELLRPKELINA